MLGTSLVVSNIHIADLYYILTIYNPDMVSTTKPGQYVMVTPYIEGQDHSSLYLKRPISVFNVDKEKGHILLYYKIIGNGTENIASFKEGDKVSVIAPLGRGFKTNIENQKILIVGAGVGIAPLNYLYNSIKDNNEVHCVFSGRDAASIEYVKYFGEIEHLYLSTDDGSVGEKMNAVELSKRLIKEQKTPFNFIYSCGPPIVLKYLGILANENNIPGQLSLEGRMACATRACQACSLITKMGSQKVCALGPVFDLSNLILEEI